MRYGLAALAVCCAATGSAAPGQSLPPGRSALAAIDACIARLDPSLDVGYARVAARCPNLAYSLERSGWQQWLPRGWKEARNDLSAGSLTELRTLVARELEPPSFSRTPRVKRLQQVLAGLGPAAQERSSPWSRFRAWLRTVVERNRQADRRSWLDRMVQRDGRSQAFIDLLTYVALGVIVLLAGVIVVNEMRAAGLLKSRARAAAQNAAQGPSRRATATWQDVERAAAGEKPRLLLELVIARLTELHRVAPAGALTVRELTRLAELADAGDRERLADLASAAERARYCAAPPAPAAVDRAVERGRELLMSLAVAHMP